MSVSGRCPRKGGSLQALICPPPRPVPRRQRAHQGNNKGNGEVKEAKSRPRLSLLLFRTGHEGGRLGGRSGRSSSSAPSSSTSRLPSSSFSLRSRCSHSDASFCACSSAGAGTRPPTSVVERKSSTAWLHLPSARRTGIVNQFSPLPASSRAVARSTFC